MKKIILFITILFISIGIALYSAILIFSEDHQYNKYTLSYFILTPKELSDISAFCEGKPSFSYSSADGPKPVLNHLDCTISKDVISSYLSHEGYNVFSANSFKKGSSTIEIEGKDKSVEVITKLEFLNW